MAQHNPQHSHSIYATHLINQIHANLDLLLQQAQISRDKVGLIKNALPQSNNRPHSALPEPSVPYTRAPSLPQPTPITQDGHPSSQPPQQELPSVLPPQQQHHYHHQYKQARALWSYHGSATDDLSFEKGEIIVVLAEENPDWWRGQVLNSQRPGGLFPSNHVEVTSQSNHSPSPQYQPTNQSIPAYNNPPSGGPINPGYQSSGYHQMPQNGDHKAPQLYAPAPPLQHTQSAPPVNITVEKPKKNLLQGRFGQALAGGAGFGAGSAVATHVVNAIL